MRNRHVFVVAWGALAAAGCCVLFLRGADAGKVWTTSTFAEWRRGTLADGGVNSYVAADGSLRLINLWDLNQDGTVDVVLPNTHEHNEKPDLFIYWGNHGFSASRRTQLPTDGAKAAAVADLNSDGYPDLIVANNFNGTKTELNSYIYWGSAKGYDPSRRIELPTQGAEAVAVADLDGDGFPEIVFANSGLTYHVTVDEFQKSYIYWGAKGNYSEGRRSALKTINARDVKVADLNRDGFPDIVFADEGNQEGEGGAVIYWGGAGGRYSEQNSTWLPGERSSAVAIADLNGDGFADIVLANAFRLRGRELGMYNLVETEAVDSFIYWGSASGFSPHARTALPTNGARSVQIADLNHDGHLDIVFANQAGGESYIYWGGPDGFEKHRRTALPTLAATHCAIADLDGDRRPDLVFANFTDGHSHNTNSYVYWNSAEGLSPSRRTELPTWGASGVVAADLNRDGQPDLVFLNKMDGKDQDPLDSWIYYGNERGEFSPARRQGLPVRDVNSYASADINNDGYVDLYFPGREQTIYWGGKGGFSAQRKTVVSTRNAFSARIADFNRDGYLDLATSEWSPGNDEVSLYWGGPNGFSAANRFVFHIGGVRFHTVADLNRDGWPDLIFPTTDDHVVIYWNGPQGFDNRRKTVLPSAVAVSVEAADLNADGFLDLIICNLWEKSPPPDKPRSFGGTAEAGTLIYWGGKDGYSESRRLWLPTVGNEDAAVADLNGDGRLDLILSSYHAGYTRSHPSYVYWNSARGFDPRNVLMLPTNSASGVLVADFNRDGYKDIFFTCHSRDGSHRNDSFLYWGGPQGYSPERRSLIPGLGPHMMSVVDIGSIYDRSDRYNYISAPLDVGPGARFENLAWVAETPFRTRVEFQLRAAATREALQKVPWQGPEGPGGFYTKSGPLRNLAGRWIQYKASLVSPDSADTPVLRSVSIRYR